MLSGLKPFKRKKRYSEATLGANVTKSTEKQLHRSLFLIKLQGNNKLFTGDCFSNLLELSVLFGPIKKSSENVYFSLKTESKHQVT